MAPSKAEIALRVVAALIDIAERRAEAMTGLSAAVQAAVDELDPNRTRDSRPTWWEDLPAWQRLDAFDRLRKAHDQLLLLEVQAGSVVDGLREMVAGRAAGSPLAAWTEMEGLAERRRGMLEDLSRAERGVRARLQPGTSSLLRSAGRWMCEEEDRAAAQRARLGDLLAANRETSEAS